MELEAKKAAGYYTPDGAPATERIVTGRLIRLLDGYTREVRIGQPVLVAVLAAAAVTCLPVG